MKKAIITGVSSGIGKATTELLLADGWEVIGLSRGKPEISHIRFTHKAIDLADTRLIEDVSARIDRIDAIIHCAGIMAAACIGKTDLTVSELLWRINLHSAEVLVNSLVDKLSDDGRIVLLGSRISKGMAGRSQYAATKAALTSMARSWAAELIYRGITVNIIAPAATDTPMLYGEQRSDSPSKLPPIGRYITAQEVAYYVRFILSPHASAITGQELIMCGGASL